MKRLFLGLIALIGCVACETDDKITPPPFEEEIAAFDWATVDAVALENRLATELLDKSEHWIPGGNGWFETTILEQFNNSIFNGYLFFDDGHGWACRTIYYTEDIIKELALHIPLAWELDHSAGILRIYSDATDETTELLQILSYKDNELIIGKIPSPTTSVEETTWRGKYLLNSDPTERAAWMERYASSIDEIEME